MSVKAERPVITPEPFSGEQSWEDWIDQFERIASINGWNDEQKLIWLKVRLTGRALLAYKKFSVTACASFKNAVVVLAERLNRRVEGIYILQSFNLVARKEQSRGQILARTYGSLWIRLTQCWRMMRDNTWLCSIIISVV